MRLGAAVGKAGQVLGSMGKHWKSVDVSYLASVLVGPLVRQ